MRLIFFFLFSIIYANAGYIDTISYAKIKKLVKEEEQIAQAYKKYILTKGVAPTINKLINDKYLPEGFSIVNLFGKTINVLNDKNLIYDVLPSSIKLKANIYDYYYSNTNRTYTKAPFSTKNNYVKIILDKKEKYILKHQTHITTDKSAASNKYYLDPQGVLHWYNSSSEYKFSLGNDLIVDSTLDVPGTEKYNKFFETLNLDVLYSGQTTFFVNNSDVDNKKVEEYLNLGETAGYIKVGTSERNVGETIIQFTRRSGGMIVNGDIYTWGNNLKEIAAIGKNTYRNESGNIGTGSPIVTTLVRAKVKTYNESIDQKNYFSSPLRPKFMDFTSDVWHSTCGITTKGELYCGGLDALETRPIAFEGYTKGSKKDIEYLYRSTFFNGVTNKAFRLIPLGGTYVALGKPSYDTIAGYFVYFWGSNNNRGWGGSGEKNEGKITTPRKSGKGKDEKYIRFKDIAFTLTVDYRRIGGLSEDGDIYTWGLDNKISKLNTCTQSGIDLCTPLKVQSDITFVTIQGGQQTFLATDVSGNYYRISQPNGELPRVDKVNDLITQHPAYIKDDDTEIIAVDITSKLVNGKITEIDSYGKGIVWVNSKKQLKGDYFTAENKEDEFFKAAISRIKWKKIRMIEDKNGMCGIDINNQMYCWGEMSFYAKSIAGNTFMLPVFNANLHDLEKDFLVTEGKSYYVTAMTSGDWAKGTKYFMKYPTYIGGFNYEFIFK